MSPPSSRLYRRWNSWYWSASKLLFSRDGRRLCNPASWWRALPACNFKFNFNLNLNFNFNVSQQHKVKAFKPYQGWQLYVAPASSKGDHRVYSNSYGHNKLVLSKVGFQRFFGPMAHAHLPWIFISHQLLSEREVNFWSPLALKNWGWEEV